MLEVYIELLKTGIRDVCMPNWGFPTKEELDFVDKEVRKHGLCTLTVKYKRTFRNGKKIFYSYQKIIFNKEAEDKAKELKRLLQLPNKSINDSERIGQLFGYREDKIKAHSDLILNEAQPYFKRVKCNTREPLYV